MSHIASPQQLSRTFLFFPRPYFSFMSAQPIPSEQSKLPSSVPAVHVPGSRGPQWHQHLSADPEKKTLLKVVPLEHRTPSVKFSI